MSLFNKALDERAFQCGSQLFLKDSESKFDKMFAGKVLFDQRLECSSPIEFRYFKKRYGKKTEPICYHCGTPNLSQAELEDTNDPDLNSQYKHVFPVCAACGATPYTNRKVSAGKRKRAASSAKVQKRARQGE